MLALLLCIPLREVQMQRQHCNLLQPRRFHRLLLLLRSSDLPYNHCNLLSNRRKLMRPSSFSRSLPCSAAAALRLVATFGWVLTAGIAGDTPVSPAIPKAKAEFTWKKQPHGNGLWGYGSTELKLFAGPIFSSKIPVLYSPVQNNRHVRPVRPVRASCTSMYGEVVSLGF